MFFYYNNANLIILLGFFVEYYNDAKCILLIFQEL